MAGFIYIQKGRGVSMGSSTFDLVVQHLRQNATAADALLVQKMLEPLEEGFNHIGLEALATEEFFRAHELFCAAQIADLAVRSDSSRAAMQAIWQEIIEKIESDARFGSRR
ncbi:MAG TPA: hypothetical protein PL015_01350 [Opitutaceae bacterium]|nr:hypothetical protein [Opitutaceae bacterium]HPG16337.1 hypothetical protein [Opitutaceae bacterium]